ncbi:MAG: M15 family metallopeptidase, partial [Candidatus Microthrix parvicella]
MRSTAELRILWAPACTAPFARLNLYGEGVVTVDVLIVDAVKALNAVLIDWDYRTRRADTGAYNCRQITGGTHYSLHSYGIAVDLHWNTNPYGRTLVTDMAIGMIEAIEGIRTAGGVQVWRWGGRYSNNKDAMHFEVVASPAELARGIQSQTTTNTE